MKILLCQEMCGGGSGNPSSYQSGTERDKRIWEEAGGDVLWGGRSEGEGGEGRAL